MSAFAIRQPLSAVSSKKVADKLLRATAALHKHLCPRQVLGVRMGVYAGRLLGIDLPQQDKRLIAFVETDGCFTDGVMVATGCSLGHRTMRLIDYGKVAVTVADTKVERAVRIWPSAGSRQLAAQCAPDAPNRWQAQLDGYQRISDEKLLAHAWVDLELSLSAIVGKKGVRVNCDICGEEVLNGREHASAGRLICSHCGGQSYYRPVAK